MTGSSLTNRFPAPAVKLPLSACGNCDNCLEAPGVADVTQLAQKLLSAVLESPVLWLVPDFAELWPEIGALEDRRKRLFRAQQAGAQRRETSGVQRTP